MESSNNGNQDYLEEKLRGVIEPLFLSLVTNSPKDVVNYSIDWLVKKGGYTANGLSIDERHELLNLRKEIKTLRELEAEHKKNTRTGFGVDVSDSEDEEEDDEDQEETNRVIEEKRASLL